MNKLKVGMWIRTNEGIRKILSEYDEGYELNKCLHYLYPEGHDLYKDIMNDVIIGEPSFDIIDVIEKGDYVNGYLVLFAGAMTWDNEDNIIDKRVEIDYNGYNTWLSKAFIKSIVTKEQFKRIECKVE